MINASTDFGNPYEYDNGIDIVPIEGASYDLVINYDEFTYRYHWRLIDIETGEVLLTNEYPLMSWGDAMNEGVRIAVDNLDLGR